MARGRGRRTPTTSDLSTASPRAEPKPTRHAASPAPPRLDANRKLPTTPDDSGATSSSVLPIRPPSPSQTTGFSSRSSPSRRFHARATTTRPRSTRPAFGAARSAPLPPRAATADRAS
ncbi:hypothetical protein PVAP13_7KG065500 [Panicum virgatum]|uniref:Uncharacterized protein n=1 Tax=Panicum virgatum TaxID=38727 RepID=A0A8T0QB25_PANVG|nr:hypothetical protein PVAP13_7KG065500 [Panicum virgatum]